MTAKQVQSLKTGDKVEYLSFTLEIVDWKCHKGVVMFENERIWAEPIFSGLVKGKNSTIHPAFWSEINLLT